MRSNNQPITLNEWNEHYEKELQEHRAEFINISPKRYTVEGTAETITEEHIEKAIRSMKNKKAAGPGGIPFYSELLSIFGINYPFPDVLIKLTKVIDNISRSISANEQTTVVNFRNMPVAMHPKK